MGVGGCEPTFLAFATLANIVDEIHFHVRGVSEVTFRRERNHVWNNSVMVSSAPSDRVASVRGCMPDCPTAVLHSKVLSARLRSPGCSGGSCSQVSAASGGSWKALRPWWFQMLSRPLRALSAHSSGCSPAPGRRPSCKALILLKRWACFAPFRNDSAAQRVHRSLSWRTCSWVCLSASCNNASLFILRVLCLPRR